MIKLESYLKGRKKPGPVYGLLISLGGGVELRLWDGSGHEELNFENFDVDCGDGLHCFKFENGTLEMP